jgi:hypothetical protein
VRWKKWSHGDGTASCSSSPLCTVDYPSRLLPSLSFLLSFATFCSSVRAEIREQKQLLHTLSTTKHFFNTHQFF